MLVTTITSRAQTCSGDINDDYSTPGIWTTDTKIGTSISPEWSSPNHQAQVSGGVATIQTPAEDWEARIFRNLGTTLCNSFIAEIDFTPTINDPASSGSSSGNHAMIAIALTAGNEHPFGTRDSLGSLVRSDQDEIKVVLGDLTASDDAIFKVSIQNGTQNAVATSLTNVYTTNGSYHITLERIDATHGRISIANTVADLFEQKCFEIPEGIEGLNFVQHSGNPAAGYAKEADFTVDNLCITNCATLDDCCFVEDFSGPTSVCPTEFPTTATYTFPGTADSDIEWTVSGSASIVGSSTSNSVTISFPSAGTYTVTATVECSCREIVITKTVTVNGLLDASISITGLSDNGVSYTSLQYTAANQPAGVTHTWNFYNGADCSDPSDPVSGAALHTATGTVFNVPLSSPTKLVANCYVIEHIMEFDNGICPPVRSTRRLSPLDSEKRAVNSSNANSNSINRSEVEVYPNPTTGSIQIKSAKEVSQIQLFSSAGQLVKEVNLEGELSPNLDFSDYQGDFGTLKILFKDETVHIQKVLFQ